MSGPASNDEIRADEERFFSAYERARVTFKKIPGVVDVAYGQKNTAGEFRDQISIVVFVREKKAEEDLPPEERIPPTFEGYRTDVRVLELSRPEVCDNTAHYPIIQGGIQIASDAGFRGVAAGTLGCIVKKRGDAGRENVYFLTNEHVLFAFGAGVDTDVYQPAPGAAVSTCLGPIQNLHRRRDISCTVPGDAAPKNFYADCAVARIDLDSKCFGSTCTQDTVTVHETQVDGLQANGADTISDVRNLLIEGLAGIGQQVIKVGRTTGRTVGKITVLNAPVSYLADVATGLPASSGHNTIEIVLDLAVQATNCKGNPKFTEQGDSGSLIVDTQGRAIGLHVGGKDPGSTGVPSSNACFIVPILDELGICIPTSGGASHGSSRALDGSGLAPAVADEGLPEGQVLFASCGLAASDSQSLPEAVPVTAAEQERLLSLRERFCETAHGDALHRIFATYRRDIGYLVRNSRPVKVVWHRCQGPTFFAHTLKHLRGDTDSIPLEVNGVVRSEFLERMAQVLSIHGSTGLREAIAQYRTELLPILSSAPTVDVCLELLRQRALAAENAPTISEDAPEFDGSTSPRRDE